MAIVEIGELKAALARGQRLMGLDLGTKTIGVAMSDVLLSVASPVETIQRTKFTKDAMRLEALMDEHGVGGLVLGLPKEMDGTEGARCQSTRDFARNFLNRRDVPIALWDERLSTSAVERMLVGDVDMTRKRRGQVIDKLAATYILQGALDALARHM
ncbi:MAG: Holliday junction resolvase RuvX [Alphaproteobacteria bacterium]|nr:Holliday junction resolvase RuvX [Alphaproteobacteria bacterium]MBF0250258.1 Holliday junction resolvase RuvX [Alphaproteobacteria bacterium]